MVCDVTKSLNFPLIFNFSLFKFSVFCIDLGLTPGSSTYTYYFRNSVNQVMKRPQNGGRTYPLPAHVENIPGYNQTTTSGYDGKLESFE